MQETGKKQDVARSFCISFIFFTKIENKIIYNIAIDNFDYHNETRGRYLTTQVVSKTVDSGIVFKQEIKKKSPKLWF